jgi:hypothetical protein
MSTTTDKPPKRTLLQRLFRGGLGRPLINLWIEAREGGYGQLTTDTKLNLGRYTVLRWQSIKTDMDQFDRS